MSWFYSFWRHWLLNPQSTPLGLVEAKAEWLLQVLQGNNIHPAFSSASLILYHWSAISYKLHTPDPNTLSNGLDLGDNWTAEWDSVSAEDTFVWKVTVMLPQLPSSSLTFLLSGMGSPRQLWLLSSLRCGWRWAWTSKSPAFITCVLELQACTTAATFKPLSVLSVIEHLLNPRSQYRSKQ